MAYRHLASLNDYTTAARFPHAHIGLRVCALPGHSRNDPLRPPAETPNLPPPTGAAFATWGVDAPFRGRISMTQYTKRIVSKKELKTVCGIPYSPQHIARLEAAGRFPRRLRLGQNRVAWLLSEVETWLDERIASRGAVADTDTSF